jgi:hypothetical protein
MLHIVNILEGVASKEELESSSLDALCSATISSSCIFV